MSAENATHDSNSEQQELARKLNLLLDVIVAERNSPYTYREIREGLEDQGISLSRARWAYMLSGEGPLVSDPALLSGLACFFGIDPSYLLGSDTDIPEKIDSQLEFVRALRAARVKKFAMRTLGDVSPKTLRAITKILEKEIAREPTAADSSETEYEPREDGSPRE